MIASFARASRSCSWPTRTPTASSTDPPPRATLLANLDAAVVTFRRVVEGLSPEQLAAPHPDERFGRVLEALVRLVGHFALHRGQISYITRLVKK